jgi:anti-sigma regulatory factor (Ser/Thr protein kinase)
VGELPENHELEMTLSVLPRVVSRVRQFIEGFVAESAERMGSAPYLADRVALATHELLENVAKYAEDRHGVLRLVSRAEGSGQRRLTVSVTNRTAPEHIERVKAIFADIEQAPDPMVHYLALLGRRSAVGESGIGLARIRAECGMNLSLSVDGNEVRIAATTHPFAPADGHRR